MCPAAELKINYFWLVHSHHPGLDRFAPKSNNEYGDKMVLREHMELAR
jgi:hypothetical protein